MNPETNHYTLITLRDGISQSEVITIHNIDSEFEPIPSGLRTDDLTTQLWPILKQLKATQHKQRIRKYYT